MPAARVKPLDVVGKAEMQSFANGRFGQQLEIDRQSRWSGGHQQLELPASDWSTQKFHLRQFGQELSEAALIRFRNGEGLELLDVLLGKKSLPCSDSSPKSI